MNISCVLVFFFLAFSKIDYGKRRGLLSAFVRMQNEWRQLAFWDCLLFDYPWRGRIARR